MVIIKDGQLLLVSGPNSFGSNYGLLPVSQFNMIMNIFFTSCHTAINHLYLTMQLSKFSAVADYLPWRQLLYVDRGSMKHDTSVLFVIYAECNIRGSELLFDLKQENPSTLTPRKSVFWFMPLSV